MTNDQITALGREYAEETYPNLSDKIISRRTQEIKEAERVIRFLLRRYCLVEKGKVEDIHKGILVQLDPKNFGYSPYNQGRIDLLKSLFPEIAKEVEG